MEAPSTCLQNRVPSSNYPPQIVLSLQPVPSPSAQPQKCSLKLYGTVKECSFDLLLEEYNSLTPGSAKPELPYLITEVVFKMRLEWGKLYKLEPYSTFWMRTSSNLPMSTPKWKELGKHLGLTSACLESIGKQCSGDSIKCYIKVLTEWLIRPHLKPFMQTLIQALKNLGYIEKKIASVLESSMPKCTVVGSCSTSQPDIIALMNSQEKQDRTSSTQVDEGKTYYLHGW